MSQGSRVTAQRIGGTGVELARVQDSARTAMLELYQAHPALDHRLVDVMVTAGNNDVAHGLNRAWRGWVQVDATAAVTLYRIASPDEAKFIRLVASGAATLRLLVF